jgi:hypothetical protein
VNVRIPPTPTLLLRLIHEFSRLRELAEMHGEPWPASLDEWAAFIEQYRAAAV